MRLIVGLGNPGRRYARTFHNAGFAAVDALARGWVIRWRASGDNEVGRGEVEGVGVLLVRPQAYMNRSGEAVAPLYRKHAESPEDLIVLHDDLDIALGRLKLKRGGGTAGHNGLRSLQGALGTSAFLRVRIGIGRPPEPIDPADFVLSRVPPGSRDDFDGGIASAAEAVRDILRDGFDKAMTHWNAGRSGDLPPRAEGDILLAPGKKTGGSISRKEARKDDAPDV